MATDRDAEPLVEAEDEPHAGAAGRMTDSLLCEISWEVCQQVGGIYTVLRSKAPSMVEAWGRRYCLVGPYNPETSAAEFEEARPTGLLGEAVKALQAQGLDARYGHWLITGRPRVVLLNPASVAAKLSQIKYLFWEHHGISMLGADALADQVIAFGYMVDLFLRAFAARVRSRHTIIAHFHEWMAGSAIPGLRRDRVPLAIVFTTHATLLGRYLAMSDPWFYDHVPFVDWKKDARRFNAEAQVMIERAAAHGAHAFTTVSDITGYECEHMLGRKPDVMLPNGLNIERFVALHEFQNLHRKFKERIHQFVMGHFFPSYGFDLDRTLYFFTSGRYEYSNKGFNLTLEALARLNARMKQAQVPQTVVFFLITRRPYRSINADVLHRRAVLEEMRRTCEAVKDQIGERLFVAAASGQASRLDDLMDDYWRLRLRRTLHAWKRSRLPAIVTHDLEDDGRDEVLTQLRTSGLFNRPEDPVKIVYHPEFITSTDPLFGIDYDQFVRGCHLGIFPSYYEPWGYAPLECLALGLPAVTTDLAGFGAYVAAHIPDHRERGIMVVRRRHQPFDAAAHELTDWLFQFVQLTRRERIALRNLAEGTAALFDWSRLGRHYAEAHALALERADL